MQKEYYIVWAYRYANSTAYNFPVALCESEEDALEKAKRHRIFRGYKYDHKIWKMPVGVAFDAEEAQLVRGFAENIVKK